MHSSRFFLCLLLTFFFWIYHWALTTAWPYSQAYCLYRSLTHCKLIFCCLIVFGFSSSVVLGRWAPGATLKTQLKEYTSLVIVKAVSFAELVDAWSSALRDRSKIAFSLSSPSFSLCIDFPCFSSIYLFFTFASQLKRSLWILFFEKIGRLMLIVSHVMYNISIGRIDNKWPVWELEYHLSKPVLPTFMKPLIRSLFNQSRPYLGALRQSLVRLQNPCGLHRARAVSEHCWPLAWCLLT